jgi:predicted DCC family thiol-disulfide oxidoreductase YuxK
MSAVTIVADHVRHALAVLAGAWERIWFQDRSTAPLELARIGIGAALLENYGLATPHLFEFWGEAGWMPQAAASRYAGDPWTQSIFFYFTSPWQLIAFHVVFLLSVLAFTVGWQTRWVKWIVLAGHLSYLHRNLALHYGVDAILSALLVILCVAPIGHALSLDRVREVRVAKRRDLNAAPAPFASVWAGACIRLMQIQMATLFFYSAVSKIRGDDWWNGDALWFVFSTYDGYNPFLLSLFASHYWLVNAATYGTLLVEIAFPFLIWQRATRPYLLAAAILLHVMIGIFMGLFYFSFVMIMGHMSFVRQEWLAQLGAWWKRTIGDLEMLYDGDCGFCRRSMVWFLAFDGLAQIRARDFRTNPSPVVASERVEKALYLVLPDGRALPGFEAYRYVVPRVPGLWWMIPFFYVPVLSRLLGHPIYNWVAANRGTLSAMTKPRKPLPREQQA